MDNDHHSISFNPHLQTPYFQELKFPRPAKTTPVLNTMNCQPDQTAVQQAFGEVPVCSPFGGLGHVTNCSELASSCYQGYVASPSVNGNQFYVGSVENNLSFDECAESALGAGSRYERGFVSNEGCVVAQNETEDAPKTNAAAGLSARSGGSTLLKLPVLALSFFSATAAAAALPAQGSEASPLRHVNLVKVGHGSWENMTVAHLGRRQITSCNSCDLFFWTQEGCVGDVYQFTQTEEPIDGGCGFEPGTFTCADPLLDGFANQNVWVSSAAPGSTAESVITVDQTCPPEGPSVLASIKPRGGCVYLGPVFGNEGLTCYPGGGSPYKSRAKRQGGSCSGFAIDSQFETQSTVARISDNVDCRTSADDCTIEASQQYSSTIESSWSTEVGFSDFGFSVGASFGMSYSETVSTGIAGTYTIPQGSVGFLGAYVPMTVFEGRFTGCEDGSEQAGRVYAVKDGPVSYRLINTN